MSKQDQVYNANLSLIELKKYLEMTNTFYGGEEKQKRRKISFFQEGEKWKRKRRNMFGEEKYFFLWIRRKTEKERGNYFEKENVFFWRRRKSRKIIGDWKKISFVEEEEKE